MGLPLQECLQKHTHRQYLAWHEWLELQWNKPDRHDYYLMLVASMLAAKATDINKFKIPFKFVQEQQVATMTPEQEEAYKRQLSKELLKNRLSTLGLSAEEVEARLAINGS